MAMTVDRTEDMATQKPGEPYGGMFHIRQAVAEAYDGEDGQTLSDRMMSVLRERDRLVLAANSARVLIERHRARHGASPLLDTALNELDDVLPNTPMPSGGDGWDASEYGRDA